jgi:hypothetical protein
MIRKGIRRPFRFMKPIKYMRWFHATEEYITQLYNGYNTNYEIVYYKLWFRNGWNIEIEYTEKL